MEAGDKVIAESGSYGAEQGSMHMSWYPTYRRGTIVKMDGLRGGMALVEMEDGSREWFAPGQLKPAREKEPAR